MATGPKKIENRGGARPRAGRKPNDLSDEQIAKLKKALKAKEKETGRSIYDLLCDIIYGGSRVETRLAGIRLVMDHAIRKSSEKDVNITTSQAPSIYLPEQRPDPAKLVPLAGGKK